MIIKDSSCVNKCVSGISRHLFAEKPPYLDMYLISIADHLGLAIGSYIVVQKDFFHFRLLHTIETA